MLTQNLLLVAFLHQFSSVKKGPIQGNVVAGWSPLCRIQTGVVEDCVWGGPCVQSVGDLWTLCVSESPLTTGGRVDRAHPDAELIHVVPLCLYVCLLNDWVFELFVRQTWQCEDASFVFCYFLNCSLNILKAIRANLTRQTRPVMKSHSSMSLISLNKPDDATCGVVASPAQNAPFLGNFLSGSITTACENICLLIRLSVASLETCSEFLQVSQKRPHGLTEETRRNSVWGNRDLSKPDLIPSLRRFHTFGLGGWSDGALFIRGCLSQADEAIWNCTIRLWTFNKCLYRSIYYQNTFAQLSSHLFTLSQLHFYFHKSFLSIKWASGHFVLGLNWKWQMFFFNSLIGTKMSQGTFGQSWILITF